LRKSSSAASHARKQLRINSLRHLRLVGLRKSLHSNTLQLRGPRWTILELGIIDKAVV
jgi:hypothetical protein